jgi:hypothetical protein
MLHCDFTTLMLNNSLKESQLDMGHNAMFMQSRVKFHLSNEGVVVKNS